MMSEREPLSVSWPFDYVYALNGLLITTHASISPSQARIFGKPNTVYLTDERKEEPLYRFEQTRDFISSAEMVTYTREVTSWTVRRGGVKRENTEVYKDHIEFRSDSVVVTTETAKKKKQIMFSYNSLGAKRMYNDVHRHVWSYLFRQVDEMIHSPHDKINWELVKRLSAYCHTELGESSDDGLQSIGILRILMERVRLKFDMIQE